MKSVKKKKRRPPRPKIEVGGNVWYPVCRGFFIGLVVGYDPENKLWIVREQTSNTVPGCRPLYHGFAKENLTPVPVD